MQAQQSLYAGILSHCQHPVRCNIRYNNRSTIETLLNEKE